MKGFFRAALFPLIVIARLVYLASQTLLGKQRSEAFAFPPERQSASRGHRPPHSLVCALPVVEVGVPAERDAGVLVPHQFGERHQLDARAIIRLANASRMSWKVMPLIPAEPARPIRLNEVVSPSLHEPVRTSAAYKFFGPHREGC